jgi:hypothetical protein
MADVSVDARASTYVAGIVAKKRAALLRPRGLMHV